MSRKMKENEQDLIASCRTLHCGYCENQMHIVYRHMPREKRRFPATVVLMRHKRRGYILFDTGYCADKARGGVMMKLYDVLNPYHIEADEQIDQKLGQLGIDASEIKTVILSHAHPDHIGGLGALPNAEVIALPETIALLRRGSVRDLVVKKLLGDAPITHHAVDESCRLRDHLLSDYFDAVYDLLGDGSMLGVRLDGHSIGQLGLYLPQLHLLFAADACWGDDLVTRAADMRQVARLIQADFQQYVQTLDRIGRLQHAHPEIQIVFSHQGTSEAVYA